LVVKPSFWRRKFVGLVWTDNPLVGGSLVEYKGVTYRLDHVESEGRKYPCLVVKEVR
jgi:hypothetical protein